MPRVLAAFTGFWPTVRRWRRADALAPFERRRPPAEPATPRNALNERGEPNRPASTNLTSRAGPASERSRGGRRARATVALLLQDPLHSHLFTRAAPNRADPTQRRRSKGTT